MDYLRRYPSGRFAALAKRNLETLKGALHQHEQTLMQDELKDIEDTTIQVADNKTRYKSLLNEAEGLYAQMSYEGCIEKYRAALKLYETHFVPDRKFIEQRIRESERYIAYLELIQDGTQAATDGNYELALQFFRKARSIDDTMKVREWITHAEKKIKGDYQFVPASQTSFVRRSATVSQPKPAMSSISASSTTYTTTRNKQSGMSCILWIFILCGIGIALLFVAALFAGW
jgi:tetratricopeptide (TPR) repeat protein